MYSHGGHHMVHPVGEIYSLNFATPYQLDLPVQGTWYPYADPLELFTNHQRYFTVEDVGGRWVMRWQGPTVICHCAFSATVSVNRENRTYDVAMRVNDVVVDKSVAENRFLKPEYLSWAFHAAVRLNRGDTVDIAARCTDDNNRIMYWKNLNVQIVTDIMVPTREPMLMSM